MVQLKQLARELVMSPEDLVRMTIEGLLAQPDETFNKALSHVLKKNAELYRRLA